MGHRTVWTGFRSAVRRRGVIGTAVGGPAQGRELLELHDVALADVYGYLLRRCGPVISAEDRTSETFFAAVDAVVAHEVLGELGAHHLAALTLRDLDGRRATPIRPPSTFPTGGTP